MWISTGIELYVDSFKAAVLQNNVDLLKLPVLLDVKDDSKCE